MKTVDAETALKVWGLTLALREDQDLEPKEIRKALSRAASGNNPMSNMGNTPFADVVGNVDKRSRKCGFGRGPVFRDAYTGPKPTGEKRHVSDPDQRFFLFVTVERALKEMGGNYRHLAYHLYAMKRPAREYEHKGWRSPKTREKNISILRRRIREYMGDIAV